MRDEGSGPVGTGGVAVGWGGAQVDYRDDELDLLDDDDAPEAVGLDDLRDLDDD